MVDFFNPHFRGNSILESFMSGKRAGEELKKSRLMNSLASSDGNLSNNKDFQSLQMLDPKRASDIAKSKLGLLQAEMGIDDFRMKSMFNDARTAQNLMKSSPRKALDFLSRRADIISTTGGDPRDTLEVAELIRSGDVEGANKLLGQTVEVGEMSGIIERMREPQPQKGRFTIAKSGENINIVDSATGDIVNTIESPKTRKEELKLKKLEADLAKTQSEAQARALSARDKEAAMQGSIDVVREALDLTKKIRGAQNLDNIVGSSLELSFPVLRESSQDLINDAMKLESMLTGSNLDLMSGVLSESDIKLLARIGSGLNADESGMRGSLKGVRERLDSIASSLEKSLGRKGAPVESKQPARIKFDSNGNIIQ